MFIIISNPFDDPLQLNYKANYEKSKTQYTLSQDTPQLKKAKANAELISDVSIYSSRKHNQTYFVF